MLLNHLQSLDMFRWIYNNWSPSERLHFLLDSDPDGVYWHFGERPGERDSEDVHASGYMHVLPLQGVRSRDMYW